VSYIRFIKDEAQKIASKDNSESFVEAFISHDKHTLFALEKSVLSQITCTSESQ
jgi:hypothetical protein